MARILVIDDEELVRFSIRKTLEGDNHNVTEASNGDEGLGLQSKQPFDIVITDLIMPVKEGIETIQQLRSDFPDLSIIAISGGGRTKGADFLHAAEALGASSILKKPFSNSELLLCVDECLK